MDEKKLKPCAQNVLAYMIDYGSITVRQAVNDLGTTELRARISEIKRAGYAVSSDYEVGKNKFGDPVRFKRYRLEGNHGAST